MGKGFKLFTMIAAVIVVIGLAGCQSPVADYTLKLDSTEGSKVTRLNAPSGLAVKVGNGNVELFWDAVPGAASYDIYKCEKVDGKPDMFYKIGITEGYMSSATSFVDLAGFQSTLKADTKYLYKVMAKVTNGIANTAGSHGIVTTAGSQMAIFDSDLSGAVEADLTGITVPAKGAKLATVAGVTVVDTANFDRVISWNSVENAKSYKIYKADSSDIDVTNGFTAPTLVATVNAPVTATTVVGGKVAGSFNYYVVAVSNGYLASSDLSAAVAINVVAGLDTPANVSASNQVTVARVEFDKVTGADTYDIYAKIGSATVYTLVKSAALAALTPYTTTAKYMIDLTQDANIAYTYKVLAKNSTNGKLSMLSTQTGSITLNPAIGPAAVGGVLASTTYSDRIVVTVNKTADDARVTGVAYKLYRTNNTTNVTTEIASPAFIDQDNNSTTGFMFYEDADAALVKGTDYSYTVVKTGTVDGVLVTSSPVTSGAGKIGDATLVSIDTPRMNAATQGVYTNKIIVSFNAVKGATSYLVYRQDVENSADTTVTTNYKLLTTATADFLVNGTDPLNYATGAGAYNAAKNTVWFVDTNVKAGYYTNGTYNHTYKYMVRAVKTGVTSSLSTESNEGRVLPNTTVDSTIHIAAPQNLTSAFNVMSRGPAGVGGSSSVTTDGTADRVILRWTKPLDLGGNTLAASRNLAYDVYMSTSNTSAFALVKAGVTVRTATGSNDMSADISAVDGATTNMVKGRTYYFSVLARDTTNGLVSDVSAITSGHINGLPASTLTATAGTNNGDLNVNFTEIYTNAINDQNLVYTLYYMTTGTGSQYANWLTQQTSLEGDDAKVAFLNNGANATQLGTSGFSAWTLPAGYGAGAPAFLATATAYRVFLVVRSKTNAAPDWSGTSPWNVSEYSIVDVAGTSK